MLEEMELAGCIATIQAGDAAAMDELYITYADAMRRYCYVRLADVEATQDCVQEIFVNVWRGIKRFEYRGPASFAAWLYSIANHMVVNFVRQRQHLPLLSLNFELQVADPRDATGKIADRLEVQDALQQLTPVQQLVITLRFFAGLSTEEAAATMGRSIGAVKALQHRAIHRLQTILTDERLGPRQPISPTVPAIALA